MVAKVPLFKKDRLFFDKETEQRITVKEVHDDFIIFTGYRVTRAAGDEILFTRAAAKADLIRVA